MERHGQRTTACMVGCKERPGVPEADTGKGGSQEPDLRALKAIPRKPNSTSSAV